MSKTRQKQNDENQARVQSLGLFKINPMPADLLADLAAFRAQHAAKAEEQDAEDLYQLEVRR